MMAPATQPPNTIPSSVSAATRDTGPQPTNAQTNDPPIRAGLTGRKFLNGGSSRGRANTTGQIEWFHDWRGMIHLFGDGHFRNVKRDGLTAEAEATVEHGDTTDNEQDEHHEQNAHKHARPRTTRWGHDGFALDWQLESPTLFEDVSGFNGARDRWLLQWYIG